MSRPLFVVIYPYKVTEFHWDLFESREFLPYCEVRVLDISMLIAPEFSRSISAASAQREEVLVLRTWREFRAQLRELRQRASQSVACAQNVVPHSSARGLAANLLMWLMLGRGRVRMFDLFISGTPVNAAGASTKADDGVGPRWWSTLRRVSRQVTTLSEVMTKLSAVAFRLCARVLPSAMTHRLVAGTDWEMLARASAPRGSRVKLVKAHSHDYSHSLLRGDLASGRETKGRSAVLLDAAGPMFGDDYIFMGRKTFITAEAWYPALTAFFDRIEAEFGVRVEIAGHYKSKHPPVAPHFGNRNVYYGRTLELVRESRFVMTRQSAAVAYAVMFRKPVIFLCSNQIEQDLRAIHGIRSLAALFGKHPVNIDSPPASLAGLLDVDEARYRAFELSCLTSDPALRPNSQIILEDIMNIATTRQSVAQGRT